MKRRICALLFAGVIAVGGVFATGQGESWGEQGFGEETSLRGTFTVVDGFPAIETPEGTYTLGAPRAAWASSVIEEGTEMEVDGYLLEEHYGPRGYGETPGSEGHLRVIRATIDGETYDVAPPAGGPGMMGRPGFEGTSRWGHPGRMGHWNGHRHGGYYGGHHRGGYPRGSMGPPRGANDGRFDQGGYEWNQPDDGYRWSQPDDGYRRRR
jgi:hypothetical protein